MLDNRYKTNLLYKDEEALDDLIKKLDHQHPIQRKLQFFLDIRGILKTNFIKGSYVEYGCFKGETIFACEKILEETMVMDNYYGIDLFSNEELNLSSSDLENNQFDSKHPFLFESFDEIKEAFKNKNKINFIKGDLNDKNTFKQLKINEINVALIDCNFLSSLESSIIHALDNICDFGFLFIDDYFTNLKKSGLVVDTILRREIKNRNYKLVDYKIYSPFAKSFMILKK